MQETSTSPKTKKKLRFSWFWFIYIILVLATIGAIAYGLDYLWKVMEEYETSTSENGLVGYEELFISSDYLQLAESSGVVANEYEPESIRKANYEGMLDDGELSIARLSSGGTDTMQPYQVYAGETIIGNFELSFVDEGMFGRWQTGNPSIKPVLWGDVSIRMPATATLYINDIKVKDDCRIAENIPYEQLDNLPERVTRPTMSDYRITNFYEKPTVRIVAETGEELPVEITEEVLFEVEDGEATVKQYYVSSTVTQSTVDQEAFTEMAVSDAKAYAYFLSDDAGFSPIGRRMMRDSIIYSEMSRVETMFYTPHTRVSFTDEVVHNFTHYTDEVVSVDVDYLYTVYRGEQRPYYFDTKSTYYYVFDGEEWYIGDIQIR